MACNIDRVGRRRRLWIGFGTLGLALGLAVLTLSGTLVHSGWWIAVVATAAGGAFCVFEGAVGWCAVRAMGLRTPW